MAYMSETALSTSRPRLAAASPWTARPGRSAACLEARLECMGESPPSFDAEIADHQVILRAGEVEAVVVPLGEYRALKALEQREAQLYWAAHERRHPSRPGDDVPDAKAYDSMEALIADLGAGE
jgi:hypothetical protein